MCLCQVIYYLNHEWQPGHGGELILWPRDDDTSHVCVKPVADRLLLFISSLEHEVLPAWRPRYALTTWMFNRRDTALEALAEDMRQRKAAGKMDTKVGTSAIPAPLRARVWSVATPPNALTTEFSHLGPFRPRHISYNQPFSLIFVAVLCRPRLCLLPSTRTAAAMMIAPLLETERGQA